MINNLQNNLPTNSDEALTLVQTLLPKLLSFGGKVVLAIIIFIIGMKVISKLRSMIIKAMKKAPNNDETLTTFLSSLTYYILIALLIISILGTFGIPVATFAAIMGAAGLAIGLSLQGTLSHLASGVMLLLFRPFKVGDTIEASGHLGTVKELSIFTTELKTPDNKQIIIPNANVWSSSIINYNGYNQRRVDMVFGISYADDIEKAMNILREIVSADDRVKKDYDLFVNELGASSVDLGLRVWVKSQDYFPVKWDITKKVKDEFDANNVSIPFQTIAINKD